MTYDHIKPKILLKKEMSQIDENIWLGSYLYCTEEGFFKERNIDCILNCAEEFNFAPSFCILPGNEYYTWHRLPIVDDTADENTETHFREGAAKIQEWVTKGKKVYVHCYAGVSRSVSVVMAYYMIYKGWSYSVAHSYIQQRRWQMSIHPEYVPILKKIETG